MGAGKAHAVSGESFVEVDAYAEQISTKTIKAIAQALATATADHESCSASADACAAVGSDSKACCSVSVAAHGETRGTDAYAEAGAPPSARPVE